MKATVSRWVLRETLWTQRFLSVTQQKIYALAYSASAGAYFLRCPQGQRYQSFGFAISQTARDELLTLAAGDG